MSVLLNVGEMIDLAIGTPEVGVVDFNMLQTVLHCLAQQLRVLGKNVEVRGGLAVMPMMKENVQTINITEYVVDDNDDNPPVEHKPPPSDDKTILVVERIKKTSDSPRSTPKRGVSPGRLSGPHGSTHSTPGVTGPPQKRLSLVTIGKFHALENTVEELKQRVYGSMPKNEAILEDVRSQSNINAIQDMWTNVNVSSRLEAAEAGIAKLSSLVQDLINETATLQDVGTGRASQMEAKALTAGKGTQSPTGTATSASVVPLGAPKEDLAKLKAHVNRMRADLDQLTQTFYSAMKEMQTGIDLPPPPPPGMPLSSTTLTDETYGPTSAAATTGGDKLPAADRPARRLSASGNIDLLEKINDLERRIRECCDKVGNNDNSVSKQLNSFQDQLEYLSKQVADLSAATDALSPDLLKDLQGLMQLFQTVQGMQAQLKQVHETALQLASEKEERQSHIDALLEQIELLKNIKLDREDMSQAMSEKVDVHMLARKVSQGQFEMACNDLSRGLEHTLGKLNAQEALWQQALDDVQREIETKLDKLELSPVKEFFNNKLKQLQENLKHMADLRRTAEAAGTKKKLLKDVNCISCDANAVMPMEATNVSSSKPMPGSMSMKPYLTYELDKIRKTQASHLPQRNLHDWENIDKQMTQQPKPQKVSSSTEKHLCNRYCGGSHTTTTAAQRVARLGHFIKQWGPDVLPLSSGLVTGDDGKMYKVSGIETANVGPGGAVDTTCTPKSPKKESLMPAEKPMSEECRCLEASGRTGK